MAIMDAFPLISMIDPMAGAVPQVPIVLPAGDESAAARDLPADLDDAWTDQFRQLLHLLHGRVREFLERQRHRWCDVETRLCRQIEELEGEVLSLRGDCAALEHDMAQRAIAAGPEASSARYAAAMEDIRALKARNAELERQVSRQQTAAATAESPIHACIEDWESEKRRILAELESDADANDAAAIAARLKVEEIVRRTDRVVAEKNREIEELRHLLQSQSNSLGSMAVGAAALEPLLDQDAFVREERENLRRLQEQWREKLRQAEIDLSVERAKIARQQVEVGEKLRLIESRSQPGDSADDALCPTGRPVRGRWLARLGLVEEEPKKGDRG